MQVSLIWVDSRWYLSQQSIKNCGGQCTWYNTCNHESSDLPNGRGEIIARRIVLCELGVWRMCLRVVNEVCISSCSVRSETAEAENICLPSKYSFRERTFVQHGGTDGPCNSTCCTQTELFTLCNTCMWNWDMSRYQAGMAYKGKWVVQIICTQSLKTPWR